MSSTIPTAQVSTRCQRIYDKVVQLSERLLRLAGESEERLGFRASSTSSWSVAGHLDHLAKANQAMATAIHKALGSDAATSGGGPSLIGRAVMLSGWIPRGKGKAPDYTRPQAESRPDVTRDLESARKAVAGLASLLPEIERSRGRSRHFAFGGLTPSQWLRIMEVHTRHHLKIINDIQRAAGSPWKAPAKPESADSSL